jgi:hypothetical protein
MEQAAITVPLCPFCQQSSLAHSSLSQYMCSHCQTHVFLDMHKGEITCYFYDIVHHNKTYELCFYPQLPNTHSQFPFLLEYKDDKVGWLPLLSLPFLPNITLENVVDKLKTILLFH